jgi:hypothetical protein
MTTRTLTALFVDHSTAERAAERLRAIGIAEEALELHRASEGDVAPGNAPSGGLFGLVDLFMPDADRAGYGRGIEGGGTVLVALRVPEALVDEAVDILDEDAADVEKERDAEPERGGADLDRLTGEPTTARPRRVGVYRHD